MQPLGRRVWAIPGGHIPLRSTGREPECTSRDILCLLNTADDDAEVEVTIYYADREPVGPYGIAVLARRVRHIRMNDLIDPEAIPLDTPYACVLSANVPVVVQFSRLDSATGGIATTMAFPLDD